MIYSKVISMTVYFVRCDHCECEGPSALTEEDAGTFAKRDGWRKVDSDYYCPEHWQSPKITTKNILHFLEGLNSFADEHKGDPPKIEE